MKRKSFTLIEILVALIVLSILASVSVAFYQKTVDTNNERICAENLKVLQAAIDIYTVENDLLPLELTQLTPKLIYLAYSRVIGERKENFLSIAFKKMFSTEQALAAESQGQIFKRRYLSGKKKLFHDPAVGNYTAEPSVCNNTSCGNSYIINYTLDSTYTVVNGKESLKKNSSIALIKDSNLTRHGHGSSTHALGITPGGRVGKVLSTDGTVTTPAGGN